MTRNKFLTGALLGFFAFFGVVFATNFSDIADHWAEDGLNWALNNGLLKGDDVVEGEEKTLRPDDGVTRAEMVTILKRYNELLYGQENIGGFIDHTEDFKTMANGITWIGREALDNEGKARYEAVKIDELGNETLLYEGPLNFFSDVKWNFSEEGKNLVLKGVRGGPEGANTTQIFFKDGREVIRSNHGMFFGYDNGLTFKMPGSPEYSVSLVISEICEGNAFNKEENEFYAKQTELIGLEISSENDSQRFDLTEPKAIDCPILDDYWVYPEPQSIFLNQYGITFDLPGDGQNVWINTSEGIEKMDVNFNNGINY